MKTNYLPTPDKLADLRSNLQARWTTAEAQKRRELAQLRQAELLAQILEVQLEGHAS